MALARKDPYRAHNFRIEIDGIGAAFARFRAWRRPRPRSTIGKATSRSTSRS